MSEEEREIAFRKFRPFCTELVQRPDPTALDQLDALCQSSSPDVLTSVQEYIIFPLQLYLKRPSRPTNYTISALEFIKKFYSRAELNSFFILKDVLSALLVLVSGPELKDNLDEDLKRSVLDCVASMLASAQIQVITEFYSEDMRLKISHLVYLTLVWAEAEKSPPLKSSALNLLKTFLLKKTEGFFTVFQGLLPGILSKLAKLCQDPGLVQSSIKAQAIQVWSGFVACLFSDVQLNNFELKWRETAQTQIQNQLIVIQGFTSHSDHRVKEALLVCGEDLLSNCWEALENSRHVIMNILVILSLEESIRLQEKSTRLINQFIELYSDTQSLSLELNSRILSLSNELGNSLGLYTEKVLETNLSLILGYLNFLQRVEENSAFFQSKVHLSLLVQNLVRVSQFAENPSPVFGAVITSMPAVNNTAEFDNFNFLLSPEFYLSGSRPTKCYRYLTTSRLETLQKRVCQTLGGMQSFHLIVEFLLEGVEQLEYLKKEAINVLNLVIQGRECTGDPNASSAMVQESVLDTCVPVINKYLNTTASVDKNALQVVNKVDQPGPTNQWTEVLLCMEGLGYIARVCRESISFYHPEMLLYCLTYTCTADLLDAHVLYFALQDIGAGCGVSIYELLCRNIYHLSKDLNLMLRQRQTSSPGLPTLIRLVLKISPSNQDREDLIDTMESLVSNLALSEEHQTLEILNLIRIFVLGYRDILPPQEEEEKPILYPQLDGEEEKQDTGADQGLITRLVEDWELTRLEELQSVEDALRSCPEAGVEHEAAVADEEAELDPADGPRELDLDQRFLKTVLEHVRHFVSMAGKPAWQIAALDSVTSCIDLLGRTPEQKPGEKQELLLPLVHQVWAPLHLLFKSNNIFVVDKAFDCLCVIGRHARDFVHRRTVTDVFPPLMAFFRTLEVMVRDRDRQNTLAAKQSRRILEKLVTGIWDLLNLLDLAPLETDPLIQALLNHLQDKIGAGETRSFFKPRRNLDANILDLKLNYGPS